VMAHCSHRRSMGRRKSLQQASACERKGRYIIANAVIYCGKDCAWNVKLSVTCHEVFRPISVWTPLNKKQ
jgi:hypothetical protein